MWHSLQKDAIKTDQLTLLYILLQVQCIKCLETYLCTPTGCSY